jgi:hypothetical protein
MVTSRAASFFNARPADPLIPLPMGPRPRLAGSGKKKHGIEEAPRAVRDGPSVRFRSFGPARHVHGIGVEACSVQRAACLGLNLLAHQSFRCGFGIRFP